MHTKTAVSAGDCVCGHPSRSHAKFTKGGVEGYRRCKSCGCTSFVPMGDETRDYALTPEPVTMTESVLVPKAILTALLGLMGCAEEDLDSWEQSGAGDDDEQESINERRATLLLVERWWATQCNAIGVPLWDV